MKILLYSDLHLEFGTNFKPPINSDADLMILAGDIITFRDFKPLHKFLRYWQQPVIYIAGNHEYYTNKPMQLGDKRCIKWLELNAPNVTFLQEEELAIDGVNFFGGTMWTDFRGGNPIAMMTAASNMNDYRDIINNDKELTPRDTVNFHDEYVQKLIQWFEKDLIGPRVVISHHAPCINPNGFYKGSKMQPAYNSLDMVEIIEKYQPALWVYGHTHEADDQMIGNTRIISNPRGYPSRSDKAEVGKFQENGMEIIIGE